MADRDTLWYRIGYGLEQARGSGGALRLRSLAERRQDKVAPAPADRPAEGGAPAAGDDGYDAVLAALAAALGSQALRLVPPRRRPGIFRLLRAGAAGAGAAVARELLRPLLAPRADPRTLQEAVRDAAVAGSARGLLYGALVEPRLPGPAVLRGLLYGYVEYLASPWGGLTRLAGRSAPHRQIPLLAALYDDLGPEEDTLADHLGYGAVLGLLYGSTDGASGEIEVDDEG